MPKQIGNIGNYYGALSVKEEQGKYFWGIADYSGVKWEEISSYLYEALITEEDRRGLLND